LQTPDFKKVIELVESSSSPQVYTNLGAYGQQLKAWNDDVAQLAASPSEKEGLRLFLGESLLQIPEESRKSLWSNANVQAELGPLVEKARQQENDKLAAVKAGEAKPASARDERVLAGQLVHVVNENYKSKAWSLNAVTEPPDDDDKQIYTFSFEPGRKAFFKADPAAAKALTHAKDSTEFTGILKDKDVAVYFDAGGKKGVSKIDLEGLQKQIKSLEKKP